MSTPGDLAGQAAVVARNPIVHSPDPAAAMNSQLGQFARRLGFGIGEYESMWRWSVSRPAEFWARLWEFSGLRGDLGPQPHIDEADMFGARFFPGGELSFTENLLGGVDTDTAVIEAGPEGVRRQLTFAELRSATARLVLALRSLGVGAGDRVAVLTPNGVESLISVLATAELGAIWSSCSPDFGPAAVVDRLGQIEPKVLITTRGYSYNSRCHDMTATIGAIVSEMPTVQHVVLTATDPEECSGLQLPPGVEAHPWPGDDAPGSLELVRRPFDVPLYVVYTSGTTGRPKAIVHGAGGVLLKHTSEHRLHCDVGPGDRVFWYTNNAWMMYHWLVSALASGAGIVVYDDAAVPAGRDGTGEPDHAALWRVVEQCRVSHFGVSPRYLAVQAGADYEPRRHHDLHRLRAVLSAGAPVAEEQFDWVYRAVSHDVMFASISGGTELLGCFVLGSPLHPVRRGEIACKALGMAVDVVDEAGHAVPGTKGELVCTRPFPSMPLTFWGAQGDERYRDAYFTRHRGMWTHGDLATMTVDGGIVIHGRSDTTLKPGGVRIGTAEIYRVIERLPEVRDCVVVGYPHDGDEKTVLCIVPADGVAVDTALAVRIRAEIRTAASPRHVPHRIYQVAQIPYTPNEKRAETAARAALIGTNGVEASLSNPECLGEYAALPTKAAL